MGACTSLNQKAVQQVLSIPGKITSPKIYWQVLAQKRNRLALLINKGKKNKRLVERNLKSIRSRIFSKVSYHSKITIKISN